MIDPIIELVRSILSRACVMLGLLCSIGVAGPPTPLMLRGGPLAVF